ncbi:MAG: hypothetical protein ACP5H2_12720, partial [Solirubrobacteraceae bacterium]
MSSSTLTDNQARGPRARSNPAPNRWGSLRDGRVYLWLGLLALLVGAFSLTYASTPSYDPWSWLIWGREILHGQLMISGGSSWKPLPVIFTTVLALFGASGAATLWLMVARGGFVLTILMTMRLAARFTWSLSAPAT